MRVLDVEEGDKTSNDADLHHILSENMFHRRRKNAPQTRLKVGHAREHEHDLIIRHKARLHLTSLAKLRPSGMRKRQANMKGTGKKHDKKPKPARQEEKSSLDDDKLSFKSSDSEGGIVFYVPQNEEEEDAKAGDEPPEPGRLAMAADEETSATQTLPWRRASEQEPESSQLAHLVPEDKSGPLKSGEAGLVDHVGGMGISANGSGASITASLCCTVSHSYSHNTDLTDFTDSANSKKHMSSKEPSPHEEDPRVFPGKYDEDQILDDQDENDENDKFSTVCSLGESETGGDCSLPPPWRSIPSIPEGGPPVRSPSASFEMDSLHPHPSNHSLRLSEAESRHSEPYPCMHHVIEVPHCRPSDCELLPFGTRIELDLDQEDLDCWERVQRWLDGNAEFLGGSHHDPPESPFLDDHSHVMAVAAADRILDLHGLDIHHDLRLSKQTLRRHASHDILPHKGNHDALVRHGSPPITFHHHIHHPDWVPAVPSHSLYQRQMSVASSLGGTSSRSPSHDDQHDHIPFSASPPLHKHCLQHLHRDRNIHSSSKIHEKYDKCDKCDSAL